MSPDSSPEVGPSSEGVPSVTGPVGTEQASGVLKDLEEVVKKRLSEGQLEKIPEDVFRHNRRLFDHLVEQEFVVESELLHWIADEGGVRFLDELKDFEPLEDFALKVDVNFSRRHAFALGHLGDDDVLLTAKPYDIHGFRSAARWLDGEPQIVLTTENQIRNVIDLAYKLRSKDESNMESLDVDSISDELQETDNLMNVRDKSPLVRLFYESITHAIDNAASDIHYQPREDGLVIRERLDGVLQDVRFVSKNQQDALISLIKVMGAMDIAERRKTQDGRATRYYSDLKVDIRISVVPTSFGERAVLRLLNRSQKLLNMEQLGLVGENMKKMKYIINNFTHGIVLVTGPTGSGKSTTLCAVLSTLNSKEQNIMTIEDPIEYELRGISQLEVQVKKNVTFSSGLRALVRQDPDVMMVGEIRDDETANMAVQSALTGHMVFSTMHTNDAPGAIARLLDLGVEPYLIADSVVAMMAQRLIRRICTHCSESYPASDEELDDLGVERKNGEEIRFHKGKGCPECFGRGYRGRTAIYEILIMNDTIRQQIVMKEPVSKVKQQAIKRGEIKTLRMSGMNAVFAGTTTVEEVLRITQADIYA